MEALIFEWDENKNTINIAKHKVSFEEASTVFYDSEAILFDDPDHSEQEERFLIMGFTSTEKLLIVSHCYRGKEDNVIRIISARKVTKREEEMFIEYRRGDIL